MDIVLAIRYFVSPCIVCWPLGSVLAFDFSVTEKKQQESHFLGVRIPKESGLH